MLNLEQDFGLEHPVPICSATFPRKASQKHVRTRNRRGEPLSSTLSLPKFAINFYGSVSPSTFALCSARNSLSRSRNSGRLFARMATASNAAFLAPAAPMASVPTGIPAGICTVASSESKPFSAPLSIGTPSTGSKVCAAQTPARWAAPPAAAMITSIPRPSASLTYSTVSFGVRCAESTRHSCSTPNLVSTSPAWRMISQSDLLPMITPTSGWALNLLPLGQGVPRLAVEIAQRLGDRDFDSRAVDPLHHLQQLAHIGLPLRHEPAAEAVGAEGLRPSPRPHLHAAVVNHLQAHPVARQFAHRVGQRVGVARGPVDEHVDALQFHGHRRPLRLRYCCHCGRTMRVRHRLQDIRLLPQPLDHRRSELPGPHLLRAHALGVD